MPTNGAPLNAVIHLSYTGDHYIQSNGVQDNLITVGECETAQPSPVAPDPLAPAEKKPEEKKADTAAPAAPVTGYTYLYGREKGALKISHFIFIPTSATSDVPPLAPDKEYCVNVADAKDRAGQPIPGTGAMPIRFRTQNSRAGAPLFAFHAALDEGFDMEGATDETAKSYALSSLAFQGEEKDGKKVLHAGDLTMFYTGSPLHPSSLVSGSFICEERDKENQTEQGDCQGGSKLDIERAMLVETLKADEDGWIRARFNRYAFSRTYAPDRTYFWRLGLQGGRAKQMLTLVPNAKFSVDETPAEEGHAASRENKAFWRETLNKMYEEAGHDERLGETDGLFFIPIGKS